MVHDFTSRAAARHLLAESGVDPSDELTDALADLRAVGQRTAPPISGELAEAMRRATSAGEDDVPTPASNVIELGRGRMRRRGAAVSGAVVLAMAAGMGGVAALGPGNAVETVIDSVMRWVAPGEAPADPVSDERAEPAQPESIPSPEAPPAPELPAPVLPQDAVGPADVGSAAATEASPEPITPEPISPAPATRKDEPRATGEAERRANSPVEVPDLPVTIPDPATTPHSIVPVDPLQLPLPAETPAPAPSGQPSR